MSDFKVWSKLLNPTDFGLPEWVTTVRPLSHLAPDCVTFVREGVDHPDPDFRVHVTTGGEVFEILHDGKFEIPEFSDGFAIYEGNSSGHPLIGSPFKTADIDGLGRVLWPARGGVWMAGGGSIGLSTVIDRGVYGEHTEIGEDTHIDNLVHVGHSSRIGPRCTIVAGTVLGGWTVLEENVWMGINSSTLPHVRVGHDAYVGAGAVCTKDVPAFAVVAGVPAKFLKWRCPCRREIKFEGTIAGCACGVTYGLSDGKCLEV